MNDPDGGECCRQLAPRRVGKAGVPVPSKPRPAAVIAAPLGASIIPE
jgi:hypothetical protein